MISQQQHHQNQGLPEVIRVRVLRGFRGRVNDRFGVANPGDVVEVPRSLAMEMRASGRAVMTDADLLTQKDYVPERKRGVKALDPVQAQLVAMTKAFEGLQRVVETLVAVKK